MVMQGWIFSSKRHWQCCKKALWLKGLKASLVFNGIRSEDLYESGFYEFLLSLESFHSKSFFFRVANHDWKYNCTLAQSPRVNKTWQHIGLPFYSYRKVWLKLGMHYRTWQMSNPCFTTRVNSGCLLFAQTASLGQRQRRWNRQIRSLWGRCGHGFPYRWEVWGFTCYSETGQRGKGLLHTAGSSFQQDHRPPSGACHRIHCQDTRHQWQWAQIYPGCLQCQCTWNVRRRWVNENDFFSPVVAIWSAFTCHARILQRGVIFLSLQYF